MLNNRLTSFLSALLLTLMAGCASTSPPVEEARVLKQPTAQDYVQEVTGNCTLIHLLFTTGKSPVDCKFQMDVPRSMTLSFPNASYHDHHMDTVRKFYGHWCTSVTEVTGAEPRFVRIFRQSTKIQSLSCRAALGKRKS